MFCGNCGTKIDEGLNCCSNCGWVSSAIVELRCSICGTVAKGGAVFCGNCGNKLIANGTIAEADSSGKLTYKFLIDKITADDNELLQKVIQKYKNWYTSVLGLGLFGKLRLIAFKDWTGISAAQYMTKLDSIYRMIQKNGFVYTENTEVLFEKLKNYYKNETKEIGSIENIEYVNDLDEIIERHKKVLPSKARVKTREEIIKDRKITDTVRRSENIWVCGKCDTENEMELNLCSNCGKEFWPKN
jgi:hypothetical protein